jgi:short-subunit dehydrogenase
MVTAAALAAEGWEVIGTCRDPRKLADADRVAGVNYLALDFADPRSVERLVAEVGEVDALVNNAGEGQVGPVEEARLDDVRALFEAHVFGPLRLVQAFVPGMRSRGDGVVISLGSMRAEIATPFSGAYAAAKAALRSFTDALRLEVARHGVRVAVLSPFHVRTGLPQVPVLRPGSPYEARVRRARESRDRDIAHGPDASHVARLVVRIVNARRPRGWYTAGRNARLLAFLVRHLPRSLAETLAAGKYDLPEGRVR